MFDDLTPKEPEDIFAQTEQDGPSVVPPTASLPETSSHSTPVKNPTMKPVAPPLSLPKHPSLESSAPLNTKEKTLVLKIIILFIAILVVIVAAASLSYLLLSSRTPKSTTLPDVSKSVEETTTQEVPVVQEEVETEPQEIPGLDTDKDGLTDAEEAELGTDFRSSDTDKDGLFDKEEITLYETDPLDADTDEYLDGAEVDAGYNPNGSGKLFEVPTL